MGKSLILGFFDGVHKAHRAVINSALEFSNDTVLITLKDSPSLYFKKTYKYIFNREHSINIIKSLGVKEVIELDFEKVVNLSAHDYLKFLIDKFHPISISTGFNHTFGAKKRGNPEFLRLKEKECGYKYICVPPIKINNEVVSSTLIKNYLQNGNIETANYYLENNFILDGIVQHGAKLGRTIGFPTANISYPNNIVKIPFGVYKTSVCLNNTNYSAIMNWGMKPTLNNTIEPIVEVHILNFNEDLYGKNIRIEVLSMLRQERKFANLDELKLQIHKDIEKCLK